MPNPLRSTAYYWVPIGLLDNEPRLEIVAHMFVGSKASWDAIAPQGVRYEAAPDLADFIALLHTDDNA